MTSPAHASHAWSAVLLPFGGNFGRMQHNRKMQIKSFKELLHRMDSWKFLWRACYLLTISNYFYVGLKIEKFVTIQPFLPRARPGKTKFSNCVDITNHLCGPCFLVMFLGRVIGLLGRITSLRDGNTTILRFSLQLVGARRRGAFHTTLQLRTQQLLGSIISPVCPKGCLLPVTSCHLSLDWQVTDSSLLADKHIGERTRDSVQASLFIDSTVHCSRLCSY